MGKESKAVDRVKTDGSAFDGISLVSFLLMFFHCEVSLGSEVGIYNRKQEIKKTRIRPRKRPRKKKKLSFFLDHFLGRVPVFLFSFINSHL